MKSAPLLIVSFLASAAQAAECKKPIYIGVARPKMTMRFLGAAQPMGERGVIQAGGRSFQFTTTFSNGFAIEHLELGGAMSEVESSVLRKNADFTNAQGTAAFIITPDLPVKWYYSTNQGDKDAQHAIGIDDTWKLVGCAR